MASSAFLFFKIFWGRYIPPFQKCVVILQSNTAQHKTSWKSEVPNSRSEHTHTQVGPTSIICDLLAKDLLYPLSVKCRAGKDQDPVKILKIQCYLALCFIRISVKQPLLRLK